MSVYATLFTDLLTNALQAATGRVQAAEPLVPAAERQDAWHWLSYALQQPALWPQTRARAPKMEQAGHRQDWLGYLQSAYTLAQQQADGAAQAELAFQIGLLQRMITDYKGALIWLNRSWVSFRTLADRRGQAQVLNEMAWVEQLRRRYSESAHYGNLALTLLTENDVERGMSHRVQGMIAVYGGRWQDAEAYHRAALAIFEQYGEVRKIGWSMVNLALAMRRQQKFDQAIHNLTSRKSCTRCSLGKLNRTTSFIIRIFCAFATFIWLA